MVESLKWHNFLNFSREVREERRYIFSEETRDFLDKLLVSAREKRTTALTKQTNLWRARLGGKEVPVGNDDWTIEVFSIQEMGAPPVDKAKDGRINVKGIPVLYVSSDPETAMSEVQPWRGQEISVARLSLLRDVRLADFSVNNFDGTVHDLDLLWPLTHLNNKIPLTNTKHEKYLWRWIDRAFSTPIVKPDNTIDYIPTQIIAEAINAAGYDGVSYNSSVANGVNYALFDAENHVKFEETKLMYTKSI